MKQRNAATSRQQERIWAHAQLLHRPDSYVLVVAFAFDEHIDVDRLREAFDGVIARHELLRSSFHIEQGVLLRRVQQDVCADVRLAKSSNSDGHELLRELVGNGLDLERAPLLRVGVGNRADDNAIVVLAIHHLIADGWSIANLLRDVETEYTSRGSLRAQVGELFKDYVNREIVAGKRRPPRRYDVPAALAQASGDIAHVAREAQELGAALQDIVAQAGVSSTAALVGLTTAAMDAMLGLSRLVVGIPIAVRNPAEETEVGPFFVVERLVVEIDPEVSLRTLVEGLDNALLEAVTRSLEPGHRSEDSGPVDLLVTHTKFETGTLRIAAVGTRIDIAPLTLEHPLALEFRQSREQEVVVLDGDPSQFQLEDLELVLEHVVRMASDGRAMLDGRLRDLGIVRHGEPPSFACTDSLQSAEMVTAVPSRALSVSDQQVELSADEIRDAVTRLADRLAERGIGPGVLVGVLLDRSVDLAIGLLAIRALGAAYLPLGTSWPVARLIGVISDAQPDIIMAQRPMPELEIPIVLPNGDLLAHLGLLDDRLVASPRDTDLSTCAYVVYTSGTTGAPKGVMIKNKSLASVLSAFQSLIPLNAADTFCAISALTFDIASLELLWPMAVGARLVVASIDQPPSSTITVLQCTPTVLPLLANDERWRTALATLRVLILGGETVAAHHVRVAQRLGDFAIFNAYGPTETTIWSAVRRIESPETASLIGAPIPGTGFAVVDAWLRELPRGSPGELLIFGNGVSAGYLGNPTLTSRQFTQYCGSPAFRTGDRVVMTEDGQLRFLGRLDDQIKIKGHRVEIAEIENVIASFPGVAGVAVVAVGNDTTVLCAFVEWSRRASDRDIEKVRNHARAYLLSAAVPTRWVVVKELPRSGSGKLDRRALATQVAAEPLPPLRRDAVTWDTLVDICRAVAPNIGVAPDIGFRAAGGESFTAVLVVAEARRRGLAVTTADLLSDVPLADIPLSLLAPRSQLLGDASGIPLSPLQRAFFARARASHHRGNICLVFRLPDGTEISRLERAIVDTFDAHDAFRLRFDNTTRGWVQTLGLAACARVTHLALDGRFGGPEMRRLLEQAQSFLDLKRGPLVGAAIIHDQKSPQTTLALFASHLVADATSWMLLLHQIADRYEGRPSSSSSFAQHLLDLATLAQLDPPAGGGQPPPVSFNHRLAPRRATAGENTVGAARELVTDFPLATEVSVAQVLEFAAAAASVKYARAGFDRFMVKLTENGREYAHDPSAIGWLSYDAYLDLPAHLGPKEALAAIRRELPTARRSGARHRFEPPHLPDGVRPELNINVLAPPGAPTLFVDSVEIDSGAIDPSEQRGVDLRLRVIHYGDRVSVRIQYLPSQFEDAQVEELLGNFADVLRADASRNGVA